MLIPNKDGWFFNASKPSNAIHDVTREDIESLFLLAENEKIWSRAVREDVERIDKHPEGRTRSDWTLDELRYMNTSGTVVTFPYGDIITFASKRHLFRGENKVYPKSLPSLRRRIDGKPKNEAALIQAIADLRVIQFSDFIWQFNIVPYWMAKLSDINFKALAQHYGFDTYLLDLTNDIMAALFFATCYYDKTAKKYLPLSESMIKDDDYRCGMIFHAADWRIDYMGPGGSIEWLSKNMSNKRNTLYQIDSGELDGMAFQIGYQPLVRCHHQSGYMYPMRDSCLLQDDLKFEKIRFKQSETLSKTVYDMMDGGKAVFPYEGISEVGDALENIKQSTTFSKDDLQHTISENHYSVYTSVEQLEKALEASCNTIQEDHVTYPVSKEKIDLINQQYDGVDLLAVMGGQVHIKYDQRERRKAICREIYGKEI